MTQPLWLTYAWADNDEGNFDHLVQELEKAGIPSRYDKVALIPGKRLWAQIGDRIVSDQLSGWAYLVTPTSLASLACQEEHSYALQRALETKGEEFPLLGLLHNVSIRDVPVSLRVRLCVNLSNPDWIEEIRASVTGKPPRREIPTTAPYIARVHENYLGNTGSRAIEIRPRFGEVLYWRLAFPSDGPQPSSWGVGPANGGGVAPSMLNVIEGEYENIAGTRMRFVGAGMRLSPSVSAYAVFDGPIPSRLFFGVAKEAMSSEAQGMIIDLGEQQ